MDNAKPDDTELRFQYSDYYMSTEFRRLYEGILVFRQLSPVVGHVVEELLDIGLLTGNPGSFQLCLVCFWSHPTLHHLEKRLDSKEERRKTGPDQP